MTMGLRRLAIVGSYPEGLDRVPWTDPEVEIWAFNEAPQKPWFKRWDVDFQLHAPEVYTSSQNFVAMQLKADHWEWLQNEHGAGKTIWMQDVDPRVPNSRRYPLDAVLALVPNQLIYPDHEEGYRYFRSSIALALGLAIYLGYEEISLYGINLVSNTEYGYQASNMAFWIGFANGHGVRLRMCCWWSEFNQRIYGYDGEVQIDRDWYGERMCELDDEARARAQVFARVKDKFRSALFDARFQAVADLSVELKQAGMEAGEAEARLEEAKRYQKHEGDTPRQEFEFTSAKAAKEGESRKELMQHAGGKFEYVWNIWRQTGNLQARDQLKQFADEMARLAWQTGWHYGVMRENEHYLHEIDQRILMDGGQHTLIALGKAAA